MLHFAFALLSVAPVDQAAVDDAPFEVVALGVDGGLNGGNLTSLLVGVRGRGSYIALDAGTLVDGIAKAFPAEHAGDVLRTRVKAYAITHAHVDHVAGLALATTDDVAKPLYALPSTIEALTQHMFNWSLWPNMGDAGTPPLLSRLRYVSTTPGRAQLVEGTGLQITAYPLSHAGTTSTAFLVETAQGDAILHLGDCGSDAIERTDRLALLWERVAPLVRSRRLQAIVLEASYPDARKDDELFGHMTPKHVRQELGRLAAMVSSSAPQQALYAVTVVVVHIKPSIDGGDARATIAQELGASIHGARVLLPRQGERLAL